MSEMKGSAEATVIGDVVDSRSAPDREQLHAALTTALDEVNARHQPLQPLRITVGDEFQGSFATVGAATEAALAVQLALLPTVQTRIGLGWGTVTALDETTQDGPGWWSAREAIVWVAQEQARAATALLRTAYRRAPGAGPDEAAVNAALHCRDHLVGSLDERSLRILRALMAGSTQAAVAEAEGVSPSAVSQRVRADGLAVISLAQQQLAGVA